MSALGYLQTTGSSNAEQCGPVRHSFRPYVGDPMPHSMFNGARCYCGAVRLVLKRCDFGHEHLEQEPA